MNETLTHADLDLLMDALKSHETHAQQGEFMGDMLSAILCRGDEKTMSDVQAKRDAERKKKEAAQRRLVEDISMLRAKLILVRRRVDAEVADRVLQEARQ